MILQGYIIIALIVSIIALVSVHVDEDFDKFVHDRTNGQVEFTWKDKIIVPILAGFTWPYALYLIIRKYVHG